MPGRADDQHRLAAEPVDEGDGDQGEEDVDDADDRRLEDGRAPGQAGRLEEAGRVIDHGVDARDLLEDGQDDPDEEGRPESRA